MEEITKTLLYYSPQSPNPITPPPPSPFTESELTAAEQLLHLSESSGTAAASGCNSAASVSSSARSVNAPLDDVADDDGLWRRNKRYRPIADVYASTVRIDAEGGGKRKKENKRRKG